MKGSLRQLGSVVVAAVALVSAGGCTKDAAVVRCGDVVCGADEVCDVDVCRTACVDDDPCLASEACRSGRCMPVVCGDGRVEGMEACDNGTSNADSAACTTSCQLARCGDGLVQVGVEACDDGVDNSDTLADACRTTCELPTCGDGVKDAGEACDGTDFGTQSCSDAGFATGNLRCSATCTLSTLACMPTGAELLESYDTCIANDVNLWGGDSYGFDDSIDSGTSTIQVATSSPEDVIGASAPSCALEVTGTVTHQTTYGGGYIGIGTDIPPSHVPGVADFSAVSLRIRGDGGTYSFCLGMASITDGDYHCKSIVAPAEWTYVRIPFTDLVQGGWGGTPVTFAPSDVIYAQLMTVDATLGDVHFFIDGIGFEP